MAIKTQGTQLYTIDPADGSLLKVNCITSIDGIDSTIEQNETTCLEGQGRTYDSGLATPGAATFGIQTDPGTNHIRLHQLKTAGTMLLWALGWSDGTDISPTVEQDSSGEFDFYLPGNRTWIAFRGFMSSFPFSFPLNAVVSSAVAIQVSGDPVLVPSAGENFNPLTNSSGALLASAILYAEDTIYVS